MARDRAARLRVLSRGRAARLAWDPVSPLHRTQRRFCGEERGEQILQKVADIMELAPVYDPTGKSAALAAALGFEMLSLLGESVVARRGGERRKRR